MTAQRDAIRMTDGEVDSFLRAGSVCRVATLDRTGSPHVVPVAYVMLDGDVAFWSDPGSQKVMNLGRESRVACVVDDGTEMSDLRGVEVRGQARLVDDSDTSRRVASLFLEKLPEDWRDSARTQLDELAAQRVVVVIEPTVIVSWDHRKLAGVRPEQIGR